MCPQGAWNLFFFFFYSRLKVLFEKCMAFKLQTHFFFFCFLFSTRELRNAHRRFYEVSEDKKPECGMEMVLLVLKDWLRLSTDANTTRVAPLVFLWSRRWQQLSQTMTLPSLFGTTWERVVSVKPGTGSLQCKVCMLFISFLSFWISTNGVKYVSHAARLVLTKSLCSHVILSDSLPSAVAATWLPTSVSRSVYRWNVPSTVGWRAVTVMRPRSADFYSNMSELFRNFPTCASWTDKELETNMYNVS